MSRDADSSKLGTAQSEFVLIFNILYLLNFLIFFRALPPSVDELQDSEQKENGSNG